MYIQKVRLVFKKNIKQNAWVVHNKKKMHQLTANLKVAQLIFNIFNTNKQAQNILQRKTLH